MLRTALCLFSLTLGAGGVFSPSLKAEDHSQRLKDLLSTGSLTRAVEEFGTIVNQNPDDDQAKVALGIVQFMQAIEQLAQQNYKYGLFERTIRSIPGTQIPVPVNDTPAEIRYEDYRAMIKSFRVSLSRAEATLAAVDTSNDLKLKFYIANAMMNIDGNDEVTSEESLGAMFTAFTRGGQQLDLEDPDAVQKFYVGVDGADVHWLRGYCNFLMAMGDMVLAYDQRDLFERCAHLFYPIVNTPHAFLEEEPQGNGRDMWNARQFADVIAFIHSVNFELVDADRMRSAHAKLLEMVRQSRLSWKLALAEKDNDQEWIPNPNQVSVIRMPVNQQQITAWAEVVDEAETVLQGKKLIPFWRKYARTIFDRPDFPEQGTGINLKKFFHEPRQFDLVLLLTGTGATPYLEEGKLSTPETWRRLQRVFQGQFFGFAVWFN